MINIKAQIKKINYKFLIIFTAGIFIRIIYFIFFYNTVFPDAQTHIQAANMILAMDYTANREPAFPFFVSLLLLLTNDPILSVKLVSFISGILTICASYYVFKKAALRIYTEDVNREKKSEYVGLLVSLCYSINVEIVANSVMGLREELISLVLILIVYFVAVKDNDLILKDKIILVILFTILSFLHLTAAIFTFSSIIFAYLMLKFKILNIRNCISNVKLMLIILTTIISISIWFIHCAFVNNDPFITINMNRRGFRGFTSYRDDSIQGILNTILYGLFRGVYREFFMLTAQISFLFTVLALLSMVRFYYKKEVFFQAIMLIFNFGYLSLIIAFFPLARLIIYFYPFLFFFGWLIIIDIWFKNKESKSYNIIILKKKIRISIALLFIIILILLISSNIFMHFNYIVEQVYQRGHIKLINYLNLNFILIFDAILLAILIFPFFHTNKEQFKE